MSRTEIVSVDDEREILYERLCGEIERVLPHVLRPGLIPEDATPAIVGAVVTGVLRYLRVMSARQLAVLLAQEANRGTRYVIHEPPQYTAAETENR